MPTDHAALVRDASRGDSGAVGALFERHLPGVLAYVRANAGPKLLARDGSLDIVQSACREVLKDLALHDYRDEAGFRHWLYLAAERKILDRARYHQRAKRAADGDAQALSAAEVQQLGRGYGSLTSPSGQVARREEIEALEAALARLPEEQRRVVVLAKLVELPHAAIAAELGKSELAVRSLLHRALARLGTELDAD